MRDTRHSVVGCLFLVVASVTTADEGSLRSGPNGPALNDTCSLTAGGSVIQWAVGDSGRVFKTVDGTTQLEYNLGSGRCDLNGVSFADESHGWIVGYKRDDPDPRRGVVFRTTSGGDSPQEWIATFPVLRPGINVPFLKVQAVGADRLRVMCADGYELRSHDGGLNWLVARRATADEGGKIESESHHDEE